MWTLAQQQDGTWALVDADGSVVETGTLAELTAMVAAVGPPERMHWQAVALVEGEPTGDGRMWEEGAAGWETPFPLTWQRDGGGHDGATTVGTVWEVERVGTDIVARGTFDLNAPPTVDFPEGIGLEAARQVAEGITDNVSIEPDSIEAELRVRVEEVEEMEEAVEAMDDGEMPPPEDPEPDEDGRILLDDFRHDDWLDVVTSGRIRTLSMVTTAAFDQCVISLADGVTMEALRAGELPSSSGSPDAVDEPVDDVEEPADEPVDEEPAAVAAALAVVDDPPAAWFDDPALDGPTPLTVDDDGRIYGHLATWGTCHVGRDDICLTPPRTASGYAYFSTGEVRAACAPCAEDGGRPFRSIPTGVITMDTGHAPLTAGSRAAAAHYDDTGTAVADVAAGEDDHGIWIAGALRPGVTDTQARRLRGSALSGDWRRIGTSLELVAALAVNVPGFPIPRRRTAMAAAAAMAQVEALRPRARSDGHDTLALVAAGMTPPSLRTAPEAPIHPGEVVVNVTAAAGDGEVVRRLRRMEAAMKPQIAEHLRRRVRR